MRRAFELRSEDSREPLLFIGPGVVLREDALVTDEGVFPLRGVRGVRAEEERPSFGAYVALILIIPLVALPSVESLVVARESGGVGAAAMLAACSLALFFCIARLVTCESAYCVYVNLNSAWKLSFKSKDHQLVIALVAAIQSSLYPDGGQLGG